ncbi:hypothetical protein FRC17_009766 [Serendipita sp. 399]|nr:hypothetical protein FRC17_009766 [Serendipita sp. 399]
MHLGSFSRMDIADFDSRGRYPTTPSPQDTRGPPSITQNWIPPDPSGYRQSIAQQSNSMDDYLGASSQPVGLNGVGAYDNAGNRRPPTQEGQRQDSRGSADSNPMPVAANGAVDQAAFSDSPIQDTAKASLPPGPRHPQAPSRASSASQTNQAQPQATMRTGSKAPAPYPFTPSTTATQLPLGAQARPADLLAADQSQFIPTSLNYGATTLQVQNAPRPQAPPQAEEVCIECMMRDRDMADVIVVGPGIWERESDAGLHELWAREDEEERAWRERHAAELAIPGSKLRAPRRASKGHRLTEQNLKIWLTLNPKEADARVMTIKSYVKQQMALLIEEAEARARTQQDAQRIDARMRDTYSQHRQSTYETSGGSLAGEDPSSGARIQSPRLSMYDGASSGPKEDHKHKRDMTLLDNGMILERVNIKREEKERKREQKKARKLSQTTDTSTLSPAGYAPPMTPNGVEGSDFEPANGNMSATSLQVSRPKSAPLGVPLTKYTSHASMDGRSPRFMGSKAWQAPWGSGVSVAPSGSMMDMHVALDQEQENQHQLDQFGAPQRMGRHHAQSSFSLPASPRKPSRPHTADAVGRSRRAGSPDAKAKKSGGIGKLWRMVRPKKSESKHTTSVPSYAQEDDLSTPLPPPPMMPYLANQRQVPPPHVRQTSNPNTQNGYLPPVSHPRSISQPGNMSGGAISPTTAPSSSLPSPTSNRFPWRESTGDDRRQSVIKDLNGELDQQGGGFQESNGFTPYTETNGTRLPMSAGSASSEYGRTLQPLSNNNQSARSPAPSTAILSSSAHSPRPVSSVHKPLPPPPGENSTRPAYISPRPSTMMVPEEAFIPPGVPREEGYGNRRESFGGATVRNDALPPGAAQALHTTRSIPAIAYNDRSQPYQEFGGPYENFGLAPYPNGTLSDSGGKSKRRSRFLPFLSKKEKDKDKLPFAPQQLNGDFASYGGSQSGPLAPPPQFGHNGRSRSSVSLATPEYVGNNMQGLSAPSFGYTEGGRPMSGYSTFTNGQRPNKALIDEIIPRDNDFLAYRYPSTEQPLDLSRR